jgi:cation transport ATPase
MRAILTLLLGVVSAAAMAADGPRRIEVSVKGMVCASCSQGLLKVVSRDPRIETSAISLEKRQLTLLVRAGSEITDAEIRKQVEDSGLEAGEIRRPVENSR